jgi:hypothetical protein
MFGLNTELSIPPPSVIAKEYGIDNSLSNL